MIRPFRILVPALAAVLLLLGTGMTCDELSTLVVTAQVSRTLDPESNTASVLLGKATVDNIFSDDWMETPDPGDTTFWSDAFPAKVTPLGGADVKLNSETVGQKLPGVYFKAAMDLEFLARYDLEIETSDGKLVTAHGFLPDSFSVTMPQAGDSFGFEPVGAAWTESDSAEVYLVGITPSDSTAQGWADSFSDTGCTIPVTAFQDSLGNPAPGEYMLSVTAVNGGWNKSGLDLFLSGGNLDGALGTFGCAVLARPVVFEVR